MVARAAPAVVLAGVLVGGLGVSPARAKGGGTLRDADPIAAALIGERIAQVDAGWRFGAAMLPLVESEVATATSARSLAMAEQRRILAGGPPAPRPEAVGAIDLAANAICDDLAPEHATAVVTAVEQTLTSALARRDQIRSALSAALAERIDLVTRLEQQGLDRTRWSVALLDALGAPVTGENLRGLAAWIGAEANLASGHNPLATTMPARGARDVNEVGVKAYPNVEVGIDATVRTLHNGAYGPILAALGRGDSALAVVTAVAISPWGTGDNAVHRLLSGD